MLDFVRKRQETLKSHALNGKFPDAKRNEENANIEYENARRLQASKHVARDIQIWLFE